MRPAGPRVNRTPGRPRARNRAGNRQCADDRECSSGPEPCATTARFVVGRSTCSRAMSAQRCCRCWRTRSSSCCGHPALVHRDCHVAFDHRFYSVPWTLVGQRVWLRATPTRRRPRRRAAGAAGTADRRLGDHAMIGSDWPPRGAIVPSSSTAPVPATSLWITAIRFAAPVRSRGPPVDTSPESRLTLRGGRKAGSIAMPQESDDKKKRDYRGLRLGRRLRSGSSGQLR